MTKTGSVGAVASQDAPILNDFLTGWLAGVKYFNDNMGGNVKYSVAYLSDSTVQGDYETAAVLYGAGCDIVYNIAGTFCLGAAKRARKPVEQKAASIWSVLTMTSTKSLHRVTIPM